MIWPLMSPFERCGLELLSCDASLLVSMPRTSSDGVLPALLFVKNDSSLAPGAPLEAKVADGSRCELEFC